VIQWRKKGLRKRRRKIVIPPSLVTIPLLIRITKENQRKAKYINGGHSTKEWQRLMAKIFESGRFLGAHGEGSDHSSQKNIIPMPQIEIA
jgi:di/tripeptidase